MPQTRRYSDLRQLPTFDERFDYLNLKGQVGRSTFGFDRWMNQYFYTSTEWYQVRNVVIVRDNGCDLGVPGHEIHVGLLVHHMNPITLRDLREGEPWVIDPEFLITTSHRTHNAIHYGDKSLLPAPVIDRAPGDTTLW